MKTKVIAVDIYGTILNSEDYENAAPVREGFPEFVKKIKDLEIKLISSSDADLTTLKLDMEEVFRHRLSKPLTLEIFDNFYQLEGIPKDFSQIIKDYKINPSQLLVIGDQYAKDIQGAKELGCNVIQVPEYGKEKRENPKFDFSEIIIP